MLNVLLVAVNVYLFYRLAQELSWVYGIEQEVSHEDAQQLSSVQ